MVRYLKDPFEVIGSNKAEFFIWFSFAIIGGQLGIIANLIIRKFSQNIDVVQSIAMDSTSGSFYTFSIALCASALGPLFTNFLVEKEKLEFWKLKIITIVSIIFFLILSSIIYSAVQSSYPIQTETHSQYTLDITQFIIYIIAIFIAMYSYCLIRISLPRFSQLDESYHEQNDDEVQDLRYKGTNLETDGEGIKL